MDNVSNGSFAMTSDTPTNPALEPLLYYVVSEYKVTIIFAPPDRAIRCSKVLRAFESKTWGEFQDRMPEADFADLFALREIYDELFVIPRKDDHFFGSNIWVGWADGDYPEWLQAHQDQWIPKKILDEWGDYEGSRLNGNFWTFNPSHEEEIIEQLKEAQIRTERRDDVHFF